MSKRQIVLIIYRHFLLRLGEKYHPQDRDREIITNFLLNLHLKYNLRLIGNKFFFTYMANQFEYRSTSRSFSKYSIPNIFGDTSVKRYVEDSERTKLSFIDDSFLRVNGIKYTDIFKTSAKPLKLISIDRKRFHNTDAGYLFCIETTTLYDKSCRECMTCKFKVKCKELKERKVNVREASF